MRLVSTTPADDRTDHPVAGWEIEWRKSRWLSGGVKWG